MSQLHHITIFQRSKIIEAIKNYSYTHHTMDLRYQDYYEGKVNSFNRFFSLLVNRKTNSNFDNVYQHTLYLSNFIRELSHTYFERIDLKIKFEPQKQTEFLGLRANFSKDMMSDDYLENQLFSIVINVHDKYETLELFDETVGLTYVFPNNEIKFLADTYMRSNNIYNKIK